MIDRSIFNSVVTGASESADSAEAPCESSSLPVGMREERPRFRILGSVKRSFRKDSY
jgi:hypothetical protein